VLFQIKKKLSKGPFAKEEFVHKLILNIAKISKIWRCKELQNHEFSVNSAGDVSCIRCDLTH